VSAWLSPTHTERVFFIGTGKHFIYDTSITSSIILSLPIFHNLRRWISKSHPYGTRDLKTALERLYSFDSKGLYEASLDPLNLSLKDALEQLFDNITISLMSFPMFR
jgi:hypothetical protein